MGTKERKGLGLKMEIDFMREEDLDAIMEIEKVSFPTPWTRAAYLAELENDFSFYRVIRLEGKVVGYAGVWLIVDEGHITNIAVHPEYRQHRMGETLMEEIINYVKPRGAVGITLEVRPSNQAAIRLYHKMGFIPTGVRKGYYSDTGEEAIIMWKYLNVKLNTAVT